MNDQTATPHLEVNRVYIKDVSFESPDTPMVFTRLNVRPEINVNMDLNHRRVEENEDFYEVVLKITVTAKQEEKVMYLAEVEQAGLFLLRHAEEDKLEIMKEVSVPHILLPFAREEINALVTKGGFQPLLLAPLQFEQMYLQKKQRQEGESTGAAG